MTVQPAKAALLDLSPAFDHDQESADGAVYGNDSENARDSGAGRYDAAVVDKEESLVMVLEMGTVNFGPWC